ncbi:hypothetical protein [Micromonospora sp. HM5-17]|uniref:hypothetical protein n=1 Tax=Micromonospora sp. HM5-17 TaxID=2487710 RepID=UPI000F4A9C2A|nr:hypothetical protein [Micromonospora sp. HM5-17]ROT25878.1 hypothetical protein EF879_26445 [Micromonospora sp. HM5-17]
MRGKLWFVGGLAVGFVLGARAGRERYEQLVLQGRKVLDHPTVQEAAGLAQAQASRLYAEGKDRLSQTRLGEKIGLGNRANGSTSVGSGAASGSGGSSSAGSGASASASGSPSDARSGSSGSGTNGTTV